jgi:hypothetical protein
LVIDADGRLRLDDTNDLCLAITTARHLAGRPLSQYARNVRRADRSSQHYNQRD